MARNLKVFSSSTPNWDEFYNQQKSETPEDESLPAHDDMDDHDDEDWEPPKWNMLK
jgi:hypothetical protein